MIFHKVFEIFIVWHYTRECLHFSILSFYIWIAVLELKCSMYVKVWFFHIASILKALNYLKIVSTFWSKDSWIDQFCVIFAVQEVLHFLQVKIRHLVHITGSLQLICNILNQLSSCFVHKFLVFFALGDIKFLFVESELFLIKHHLIHDVHDIITTALLLSFSHFSFLHIWIMSLQV